MTSGKRQSVKMSITLERSKRPNQWTNSGMRAILGSGKANENSGSKNHSAQRTRPMRMPSGTPTAIAPARPSKERQSVFQSGQNTWPLSISVTQRMTISVTGGKTNGFTTPVRVTSSQASRKPPIGSMRASAAWPRPSSVGERMPGHVAAQRRKVQPVEQIAERGQPDDHRQHRVVG